MMIRIEQRRDAERLLRDGWSDEAVGRLTALSLEPGLGLRAETAAGASFPSASRRLAPCQNELRRCSAAIRTG